MTDSVCRSTDTVVTFEDAQDRPIRLVLPAAPDETVRLVVEGAWRAVDRARVEWLRDTLSHWLEEAR